ncbi:MAG: hypothetical protein KTR14_03640 [Vampirovibrio sp.]|nr:hypothetical protein [Vampirovibrio sp.]
MKMINDRKTQSNRPAKHQSNFSLVELEHLPPYHGTPNSQENTAIRVAGYMQELVQQYRQSGEDILVIPPMSLLTDFFGCSELKLFEAFSLLRRQGYQPAIFGLDALISLRLPRKKPYAKNFRYQTLRLSRLGDMPQQHKPHKLNKAASTISVISNII